MAITIALDEQKLKQLYEQEYVPHLQESEREEGSDPWDEDGSLVRDWKNEIRRCEDGKTPGDPKLRKVWQGEPQKWFRLQSLVNVLRRVAGKDKTEHPFFNYLGDIAMIECDNQALKQAISDRFPQAGEEASLALVRAQLLEQFGDHTVSNPTKDSKRGWGLGGVLQHQCIPIAQVRWLAQTLNVPVISITPYKDGSDIAKDLRLDARSEQEDRWITEVSMQIKAILDSSEHVGLRDHLARKTEWKDAPQPNGCGDSLVDHLVRMDETSLCALMSGVGEDFGRTGGEGTKCGLFRLAQYLLVRAVPDHISTLVNLGQQRRHKTVLDVNFATNAPVEAVLAAEQAYPAEADRGKDGSDIESKWNITPTALRSGIGNDAFFQRLQDVQSEKAAHSAADDERAEKALLFHEIYREGGMRRLDSAESLDDKDRPHFLIRHVVTNNRLSGRNYFVASKHWGVTGQEKTLVEAFLKLYGDGLDLVKMSPKNSLKTVEFMDDMVRVLNLTRGSCQ